MLWLPTGEVLSAGPGRRMTIEAGSEVPPE